MLGNLFCVTDVNHGKSGSTVSELVARSDEQDIYLLPNIKNLDKPRINHKKI